MKPARVISGVIGVALLGGVFATVAIARSGDGSGSGLVSQELAAQGVVWHGNDLGVGERVILVVGGAFPTRSEAVQANAGITFGDLQGYYVAPIEQFPGLKDELGVEDANYVLVTAFRTLQGALDFVLLTRAHDAPARVTSRLPNRGYEYVGLGQEAHPDGSGPLIGPLQGVSTP
jgi:hypothetical protein